MTEKRYDVIYEKEPRGQVVTDNGIPCTARTCCTRLNILTDENEQLRREKGKQMEEIEILSEENKRLHECINEIYQISKNESVE